MRHITLFIATLLLTTLRAQQPDTTTVSDHELEQWLETYATPIPTTDTTNRTDTTAIPPTDTITTDIKTKPTPAQTFNPQNINNIISDAFSRSTAIKNKLNPTTPTTTLPETPPTPQQTPKPQKPTNRPNKTPRPKIPTIQYTPADIITPEDSAITHYEALATADHNPMFLDWVACSTKPKSKNLTNADSTIINIRNNAIKHISRNCPDLFDYHITQLPETSEIKSRRLNSADADKLILRSEQLKVTKNTTIDIDGYKKPKWTAGAKFQLQASQSYISPNWYKGGESNIAGNLYATGYCNYNNHNNIQWDNKIEWKLGVNSTGSDTLRKIGVNDDLFRINSKLGVKAFNSFFYTAEYDLQTTLFNTYRPQTYIRSSGPFSPIRMNLSLGIDYKYKKKLSILLSPLSYKFVYVSDTTRHHTLSDTETIPHIIGITDGTRSIHQLGALIRIGWEHKFSDAIEMEVKFSFFGNYVGYKKGIETDLEVIGNFQINRFLSAKVSLNPRFDSTVPPADGGKPKLQFRELISLGFNYVI